MFHLLQYLINSLIHLFSKLDTVNYLEKVSDLFIYGSIKIIILLILIIFLTRFIKKLFPLKKD